MSVSLEVGGRNSLPDLENASQIEVLLLFQSLIFYPIQIELDLLLKQLLIR